MNTQILDIGTMSPALGEGFLSRVYVDPLIYANSQMFPSNTGPVRLVCGDKDNIVGEAVVESIDRVFMDEEAEDPAAVAASGYDYMMKHSKNGGHKWHIEWNVMVDTCERRVRIVFKVTNVWPALCEKL